MIFRAKILILLAALLLAAPASANYRQKAEEATDFIQAHFYDAGAKRYHDSFPMDAKGLPYTTMWGNGVQFTALVAAAHQEPAKYKAWLYQFTDGLQAYWDPQPKGSPPGFNAYCSGPGGTDKYYDDNEWMVLGFAEAYQNTRDPHFLQWARDTQNFVLSGWDDTLGGGIYWKLDHQSKNTCSNAPAAASALRLVQVAGDKDQLAWALKIRTWLNGKLQDTDGLYWDDINLKGDIGKTKWTYNTALMIRTNTLLFQQFHDRAYLKEAEREADASIKAWQDPDTGRFQNNALFTHLLCESLLRLYDADHDVRYLNAVRRHAAYGYRYVHDPAGGWWGDWDRKTHPADERKVLIENAADARLFWLLTPYQDVDELNNAGIQAAAHGQNARAETLFRQAADSDTEAVEAHYRLWRVLQREKKTRDADAEAARLAAFAKTPAFAARLQALGWHQP
ncbi:MAG: hypothetical protein JO250_11530 [Armatimonadetes bacterium]|nr:hypothetical protein [Armatimonadota bacterium]